VHALRTILGTGVLERAPAGYVVHVEPGQFDLERFERLVAEARTGAPAERAAKLRDALGLWRGPPLVELPTGPFAQPEIHRLEEERLTALEDRVEAELELGRHTALVGELEALVDRHPLRERFWAQLMLALYRAGRQADALAAYRRAHQSFVDELGIEPGVVLRDLQRAILIQDAALDDARDHIGSMLERAAAILPRHRRERAESLYEYGVALIRIHEGRRAAPMLEAAARMAAAMGEHGLEQRARLYRSYIAMWVDGKSPFDHLAEAERAAKLFEDRGDDAGLWLALRQQCQMLREASGRPDASIPIARRAAEAAARLADPWQRALSRGAIALAVADGSTRVDEAIAECEAELTAAASDEASPLRVWFALTELYAQAGRIGEARALAVRADAAARLEGQLGLLPLAMARLGTPDRVIGNFARAATHFRAAYALVESQDNDFMLFSGAAELACLLARSGDLDEAERLAHNARSPSPHGPLVSGIHLRRALALVAAHAGRSEEALRFSNEARASAAATDWLTLYGETLEESATIHDMAGDSAGADEALRQALAKYELKGNLVGAERVRQRLETVT
jgi:DNA-binding SARP family transcriptional activator